MHTIRKSLLLCLVLAATAVTTRAATLNVPGQYLTIQAAISAAADGDTVQVAAGTYVENITWNNRALILEGAGEGQSIIDGGSANSCLHLLNVPSTARIVGFTIQNGNAPNYGGGMHNESSSPTVTNCTFRNNYSSIGGGMMNSDSSPAVINCTFTGNSAINFGGGMDNHANSNPTVVNCIFTGNSTPFLAGGMDNVDSSPAVTNCTFTRNSSSFGGAMVFYYGSPSVINCTFTGNSVADIGFGAYGTIYSFDSHILVINCILWGDTGGEMSPDPSSTILPIVTYSDVQGGYAGTGNIDADPLFVNAVGGDMRLQAGSPCINAGNNAAVIVTTDLDGNPRNGTVDIGAFEVPCDQPVATITGPASGSVYAVGTPVTFTGTFTGTSPHSAQWTIGGNVVEGVVDEIAHTVTATVNFTSDGVYAVELTVANACGNSTTSTVGDLSALVVIYDPSAGFVTGGGWIISPRGAAAWDPTLTGKANFGFVSKYEKGKTVPTGNTEFQFNAGNLDFHSTSYEWLVISGARAQYKGVGDINGAPGYRFLLTAIDGQNSSWGGSTPDKFRIKIWDATGIVYDNQMGADDSSTPTTTLGGGSIVIHK